MQEGPYEFTVITYDGLGNKSIPVTANGYVYGDLYEQSLVNRSIEGDIVTTYEDGEFIATIKWLPLNYEEAQETCLTYELADGSGQKSIKVNTGDNRSVITGAKPGGRVRMVYRLQTGFACHRHVSFGRELATEHNAVQDTGRERRKSLCAR